MKKVLCILLILAGLFGIYGGLITLKDVNACKAYWEEEGENAISNIDRLDDGLNQLGQNTQAYMDGLKQVEQGEKDLAQGEIDYATAPLKLEAGKQELAAGKASLSSLETLISSMNAVSSKFPEYEDGIAQVKDGMVQLSSALKENGSTLKQLGLFMDKASSDELSALIDEIAANTDSIEVFTEKAGKLVTIVSKAQSTAQSLVDGTRKMASDLENLLGKFLRFQASWSDIMYVINSNKDTLDSAINMIMNAVQRDQLTSLLSQMSQGSSSSPKIGIVNSIVSLLRDVADTLDSSINDPKIGELKTGVATLEDGLKQLQAGKNGNPSADTEAEQLGLAGGLKAIYSGILGSTDQLVPAIKAKNPKAISTMKYYAGKSSSGDVLVKADLEGFATMGKQALKLNSQLLPGFKAAYKDGEAKVKAGQKELKKGQADYKAAPGKLAAGRKQLEDGKAKLAEYEDGEQQIRDGLATLMNEKAHGGVMSIKDRVGADEDFSLADSNLDFDASYAGAQSGREYVSDLSAKVTKELTQRAIGFVIGMVAGLLALLSAILGLIRKNKGAAVLGILAAVAAGAGAIVANAAGIELSTVAGSSVGTTPLLALGILFGIALANSIMLFTSLDNSSAGGRHVSL